MEQDRYGNWIDLADQSQSKSAAIRAQKTRDHNTTPDQVEQFVFTHTPRAHRPANDVNRRRDHMLADEERRRGGPVSTNGDHSIQTARAYPLPRYRMELPQQPKQPKPSRRALVYAGIGLAAVLIIGGSFVKAKADDISQRETDGQFGHIIVSGKYGHDDSNENQTRLEAWVESDYRVRFLQVNGNNIRKTLVIDEPLVYKGPLKGIQINLEFNIEKIDNKTVVVLSMDSPVKANWTFRDNGTFFVE